MPQPANAPNPPQNSALLHQPGFASGAAAFSAAFSAGFSDSKRRGALRCAARARRARVPLAAARLAKRLSSIVRVAFVLRLRAAFQTMRGKLLQKRDEN